METNQDFANGLMIFIITGRNWKMAHAFNLSNLFAPQTNHFPICNEMSVTQWKMPPSLSLLPSKQPNSFFKT